MFQSAISRYLLLNGLIALIAGITVNVAIYAEAWYFFLCALGGMIFAALLFWFLIVGRRSMSATGLAIAGLLTGSISHYFCWLMLAMVHTICYGMTGGCTDSLGNPPAPMSEMITGAFTLTAASLIVCGWFTVPASILAAFATRWWQRAV